MPSELEGMEIVERAIAGESLRMNDFKQYVFGTKSDSAAVCKAKERG
jgi:hypothetical protein